MDTRGYLPLKADRFTAFQRTLTFQGLDLTGVPMKAQVRQSANDTGTPLASLAVVTNPALTGFRLLAVNTATDGSKTSVVGMLISAADIIAMTSSMDPGGGAAADLDDNDLVYAWDMQIPNSSGFYEVFLYGPFILRAGVTR